MYWKIISIATILPMSAHQKKKEKQQASFCQNKTYIIRCLYIFQSNFSSSNITRASEKQLFLQTIPKASYKLIGSVKNLI